MDCTPNKQVLSTKGLSHGKAKLLHMVLYFRSVMYAHLGMRVSVVGVGWGIIVVRVGWGIMAVRVRRGIVAVRWVCFL